MPHHRYPSSTVVRTRNLYFKVSDDVLIQILKFLDPALLWKASKALTRIRRLVRDVSSLRYTFELGRFGLMDGPLSHRRLSVLKRAEYLQLYRQHWDLRRPTKELTLTFREPVIVGLSGRMLFNIQPHGVFNLLGLYELPSPRLTIPVTQWVPHQCPHAEDIAIDQVQGLLMTVHCHINNPEKHVSLNVHFRDLCTRNIHPQAFAPEYNINTQVSGQIMRIGSTVCGAKVLIDVIFVGGKILHLLMNWHTFQARWLKDLDLHFMDERTLLGLTKAPDGTPYVSVYDLQDVMTMGIKGHFVLPTEWGGANRVEFANNSSPRWDTRLPSNALFTVAHEQKMLVIVTKATHQGVGQKWLCVPENFFMNRWWPRRKATPVPWNDWKHACRPIMNITPNTNIVTGPYTVGCRAVYVDHHEKVRRLCILDLSPCHDLESSLDSSKGQHEERHRKIGEYLVSRRPIPPQVYDIKVTEDNLLLFSFDKQQALRTCEVWTFGAPP